MDRSGEDVNRKISESNNAWFQAGTGYDYLSCCIGWGGDER